MSPPTFFFSYARQDDWSSYLSRFFDDLENVVAQWSAHSITDGGALGTIDRRFPNAEDWSTRLAEALRRGSAFVMAESPVYYARPDCGKELRAFLRRSAELGIDANGALTGVKNVIRVRWMPEAAYSIPPDNRSRIPAILGRIQYAPPERAGDDDRNKAIRRYVEKGMKNCVDQQGYNELLDAFAETIFRSADTLPEGEEVAFETEDNAFDFDWGAHFDALPQAAPQDAATGEVLEPEGLRSVVAFHLTQRPFTAGDAITFADMLIAEGPGIAPADPGLAGLLAELRRGALEEHLQLFNVAPTPPLPFDVPRLAGQLRALMDRGVSTLLVVDPQWLLAQPAGAAAVLLRQLLEAIPDWSGIIVVADDGASGADTLVPAGGPFAVPGALVLPSDPGQRAFELRRTLIDARGRAMRALGARAGDSSTLPLLSAVGSRAA